MREQQLELIGTPEDVQKMLNVASRVEPGFYQKKRIAPGHYRLWYRGDGPPNDLVRAIKKRAGLIKSRPRRTKQVNEGG